MSRCGEPSVIISLLGNHLHGIYLNQKSGELDVRSGLRKIGIDAFIGFTIFSP